MYEISTSRAMTRGAFMDISPATESSGADHEPDVLPPSAGVFYTLGAWEQKNRHLIPEPDEELRRSDPHTWAQEHIAIAIAEGHARSRRSDAKAQALLDEYKTPPKAERDAWMLHFERRHELLRMIDDTPDLTAAMKQRLIHQAALEYNRGVTGGEKAHAGRMRTG